MPQNNILVAILEILEKEEEERKKIIESFNQLCRIQVIKILEESATESIKEKISSAQTAEDYIEVIKAELEDKEVKEKVLNETMDFIREFLETLVQDATKKQKSEIAEYMKNLVTT